KCGEEVFLPFRCPYCGGYFCTEHRLPENHECPGIDKARPPQKEASSRLIQRPYPSKGISMPIESKLKARFSQEEIKHLIIASVLVLGVGFSMGIYPGILVLGGPFMLLLFAVLVLISFIIHELAHKFTAQKQGVWAEFRLVFTGALLTAISLVSPIFKIIAPGAVFIAGVKSRKAMGKISIAGPSINLVISAVLLALWFMVRHPILSYGAAINAWIAVINLIPFGMLDGYKILLWNKSAWVTAFAASLALTIATYIIT
ncbi:hypothetical protein H5T51_03150, partial [Candidatus Bathyarchaeota archaeon]|nr:hypothetical protein [Candidatus Bathyarchaeota archaeon]